MNKFQFIMYGSDYNSYIEFIDKLDVMCPFMKTIKFENVTIKQIHTDIHSEHTDKLISVCIKTEVNEETMIDSFFYCQLDSTELMTSSLLSEINK